MAQLSEQLVRDTIRIIDSERKLQLTINEVRQLCYAWLQLHGHSSPTLPVNQDGTRYSNWCAVTHGHEMMAKPDGSWVLFADYQIAIAELLTARLEIERLRAALEQKADVAAATAHRACCGTEHDAANGKLHGYCVVCGVPWPCDTASYFLRGAPETGA